MSFSFFGTFSFSFTHLFNISILSPLHDTLSHCTVPYRTVLYGTVRTCSGLLTKESPLLTQSTYSDTAASYPYLHLLKVRTCTFICIPPNVHTYHRLFYYILFQFNFICFIKFYFNSFYFVLYCCLHCFPVQVMLIHPIF
jgi:hypothetical protein